MQGVAVQGDEERPGLLGYCQGNIVLVLLLSQRYVNPAACCCYVRELLMYAECCMKSSYVNLQRCPNQREAVFFVSARMLVHYGFSATA